MFEEEGANAVHGSRRLPIGRSFRFRALLGQCRFASQVRLPIKF